jgi:hypothetical protein
MIPGFGFSFVLHLATRLIAWAYCADFNCVVLGLVDISSLRPFNPTSLLQAVAAWMEGKRHITV